jgi:hypothetical protein
MAGFLSKRSRDATGRSRAVIPTIWKRIEDLLRYAAASLFALLFLVVVFGLPALLVVTSTHGLGDTIRHRAEELLGGKDYEVQIGKVLFSPLRGFILDRIQVHDRTPQERLVCSADHLSVSVNMDSILRGSPRLERINLRDVTLDIPLGPTDQPRLRLDHARGVISCTPGEFRVSALSFELAKIRVELSGTFLNPKKFAPKPVSTEGPGKTAQTIDAVRRELDAIIWEGRRPVLTIVAGGDLSDSESLRVEGAHLETGAGKWRALTFRHLELSADYAVRKLRLEKLLLDDGTGILQAVGSADFRENRGWLEFGGALSGAPIPQLLLGREKAKDWEWIDPIRLDGKFGVDWSAGKPVINGTTGLAVGRFGYKGVSMWSLSGGAAFRDGKILIRDLQAEGDPGSVKADLLIGPGDNRVRLSAGLFPGKLAPAATGHAAEALGAMDFKDPLLVTFEGGMPGTDPTTVKGSGSLSLGRGAMRGAWIDGLSSRVEVANGAASFRDILVRMGEGNGRGEFVYDYKNWEGRFPGVRTSLDPVKVMTWIDPRIAEGLKEYRFNRPPEVQLTGKVGLKNPAKNDLRIVINAPSGMGYTLIGRNLPFGATSGTVLLKGQKLLINIPTSRLFGGDVALKAAVSVAPGDSRYGASVHLEDVDFKDVTKLYFDYEESSGKLTADYAFRAVGGNDRAMTGKGNLLIKDGNVLAMPVLGPLSLLLGEVIPGFGYQSAREATADFTVENGAITTRDLLIKGKGFSMIGNGSIFYLDDRMNMNIRLNAQGLPGVVLFPVSKIFEYESVGSAKNPKWRPKLLPKLGGSASPSPQPQASPAAP